MAQEAQEFAAARPNRPPTHPGAIFREDVMPAIAIPVAAAARYLNVTRQHLHKFMAEECGVSPEMAVKLGKLCGNGPVIWMRMQEAFDLWHASKKLKSTVEAIPTLRSADAVS